MARGRPAGYQMSPEEKEAMSRAVQNAWREPAAGKVERAEPEIVQAGLASAIREGRVPPKYADEVIVRLMPPTEEEEQ